MSYTPPLGDSANASWLGFPTYVAPSGDAVDADFATSAGGVASAILVISAEAVGFHGGSVAGTGAASLLLAAVGAGLHAVGGPAVAALGVTAAGSGRHGVAGAAVATVAMSAAGVAVHPRYELRGVVMIDDVLVDRRVRAYLRSTGALVSQADTVAGKFNLPAGFAEDEFTVTPIDMSPGAVDWLPPTANRVLSVLADDVA